MKEVAPTWLRPLSSSASSSLCSQQTKPPSEHQDRKTVIPKDIPVARNTNDPLQGPALQAENNDVYRHAMDGRKLIIGPMPVRAFLDEFLPATPGHKPMPKSAGAFSRVFPMKVKHEREMSETLVRLILLKDDADAYENKVCCYREWKAMSKRQILRNCRFP